MFNCRTYSGYSTRFDFDSYYLELPTSRDRDRESCFRKSTTLCEISYGRFHNLVCGPWYHWFPLLLGYAKLLRMLCILGVVLHPRRPLTLHWMQLYTQTYLPFQSET